MNIFLVLLIVSLIAFITWCYMQKRKFRSLNRYPGPKSYPILGSILEFSLDMDMSSLLATMIKIAENAPIATVWMGPVNCFLLVTDPELMELILSSPKHVTKSVIYDSFKPWLRNGLLVSNGCDWQKRRKILTPAFGFKILEGFVHTFNEQTDILINRMEKEVDKGAFNIYPYLTAFTLDIICETAMGASVNVQSTVDSEYVKAVDTVCRIIVERVFSAWKQFDMFFKFSSSYRIHEKALNIIHRFSRSVIKQRRKNNLIIQNGHIPEENTNDMNIKKKHVLLDVLLNATIDGEPLTDLEIQEEVDTFMFGGHDTSATLLGFAIYELSKNPDCQNKMLKEVREIFNDDKNYQPTLLDLNNLKYTELVLKETLRLFPPAIGFSRVLREEVTYKGTILPKDTLLGFFPYGMHRREDLFPNATKFDPERFLSDDFNSNPYAYVPFCAGPRNCIGQKFAMYENKTALSKIILNYEILPVDSYEPILSGAVILKSVNGIHIQLKHRKPQS